MVELVTSEVRIAVQVVLAWTVCLAALLWGGGPERAVASTWLIIFEIGLRFLPDWFGVSFGYANVEFWPFIGDLSAAAILVFVALIANRNYTLGIAAMQLLAMTAHFARSLTETIAPIAYLVMTVVPGWSQLFLLGFGLSRHILRKRKYGEYRDWRKGKPDLSAIAGIAPLASEPAWQDGNQPSWRDDIK